MVHFLLGIRISNIEALSEVIYFGWTQAKYKKNRKKSKARNACTHPSWHEIDKAKAQCTPPNINLQEREATISIKDAMYHQLSKILKDAGLVNRMKIMKRKNPNGKIVATYKYGGDGSSQYSHHRNAKNDTKLFASNLVPILIDFVDEEAETSVNIWANHFANSAYGVVPLRWAFEGETTGE